MSFSKTSRRTLLAGACSVPLALSPLLPAHAQSNTADDEPVMEEVVVSGIRQSIRKALEVKRSETSIVEVVSAEDIGKLPDQSIAESIARLPGLTAQRLRGRAQVVSVRGLGPDFTTALLNGREQVTAGDNRGVEFDQYPAELLSQVVVYKTPDASLIGQGLAGTADLRTVRPLDYGEQTIAINARYEWNGEGALNAGSEDTGHRITASYIDQFADDTVGVVLGFSTQTSPTQAERWDAWGYPTVDDALILGGAKPYVESRELERDAFLGTIEFRPNDDTSLSADVFYSEFKDTGLLRGIELPLQWSGAQLQPGFTTNDGLVTGGTFNGVQGVVRNDARFRDADVFAFGINGKRQINDRWSVEADFSVSEVDRVDTDLETYVGTGSGFGNGASDNLGFSIGDGGSFVFDSTLDYSDPNTFMLTDPQGWGQVGFIKEPSINDELQAIRLSANRAMDSNWLRDIEFGVNLTTRDKSKRSAEAFVDLANGGADNMTAIPSDLLLGTTSLDFLGISSGIVSYDPVALLNTGVYTLRPNTNPDVRSKQWDVSEDVLTAYIQFNVDTTYRDMPLTGNFGLQVVETDQSSTGPNALSADIFSDFTDGVDYTEVLPSVNLSLEVRENMFLRASAARTLMRGRLDQIRASQELSLNNNICTVGNTGDGTPSTFDAAAYDLSSGQVCLSASGGNPQLRPFLANAFDLSFERYFPDVGGYVSVALFYKDVTDYIDESTSDREVDLTNVANAIFGTDFVAANPQIATGILSAPNSREGGTIQGIELAFNLPMDAFLPAPFDGFGLNASYSYTDSEIRPDPMADPITIPGLSEDVASAQLYYEKAGFQARVSYRYRSDFLGEVTGFGAGREFRDVQSESVVDGQIGYTVQSDSWLGGATFVLQGYNLTDEEFVTALNMDPRQVKDFQSYGRTFLFGVNYKF